MGGWGCTHYMHGRSRMTVEPRVAAMPGRSTLCFERPVGCCRRFRTQASLRAASAAGSNRIDTRGTVLARPSMEGDSIPFMEVTN